MKKLIFTIALFSLTFSCKKQFLKSEIEKKWENCNERYDKITTLQKLIGNWKYIAIGCTECSNSGITLLENTEKVFGTKQPNVEIRIMADQKISILKNSILLKTTDFELIGDNKYFRIETNPLYNNDFVWGTIIFCQNMVVFSNSSTDGPDYYYERIK